jgi:hypothetical protein
MDGIQSLGAGMVAKPSGPGINAVKSLDLSGWPKSLAERLPAVKLEGGFGRSELWDRRAWGSNSAKGHRTCCARAIRSRLDFSKIPTAIQIPEPDRSAARSYERFLQMDKLPRSATTTACSRSLPRSFPITDFRNVSSARVCRFLHRQLGVQVRPPQGPASPAHGLHQLRHMVITDPFHPGDVLCHFCGTYNKNTPDFCNKCGDPVGLQLKYDQAGVRRARHDLLRSAQGHHPPEDLRQGPRDRRRRPSATSRSRKSSSATFR